MLSKFCKAESNLENYLFSNPLLFSSNFIDCVQEENGNEDKTQPINMINLEETESLFRDVISKAETNVILFLLYYAILKKLLKKSSFRRLQLKQASY